MHQAFVPFFEDQRGKSPGQAVRFYQGLGLLLAVITGVITLLALATCLPIYFFADISGASREILLLTMLLMPSLIFLSLSALQTSFLQCVGVFFLPGLSPACVNVFWIVGAWFFRHDHPESAMIGLSLAVLSGYFFQWLLLLPESYRQGKKLLLANPARFCMQGMGAKMRRFLGFFGLGAIGVSAAQLNSALDALFARSASLEGPAYLWYAIRIQQLPLALFGVALSGALLPSLSRAVESQDDILFGQLVRGALKRALAFVVPATCALLILAYPLVTLVYTRGDFSLADAMHTTRALWGYGLGLPPMLLVVVLAPAFYAKKQFKIPVLLSVVALIVNVALNAIFIFGFGLSSLSVAISTAISAWINLSWLLWALRTQLEESFLSRFVIRLLGMAVVAAGVALVVQWGIFDEPISFLLKGEEGGLSLQKFSTRLGRFFAAAALFGGVYLALAKWIGEKETLQMLKWK